MAVAKQLENWLEIAEKHNDCSEQHALSDLLTLWIEMMTDVDLGLFYCTDCNKVTDEYACDERHICKECLRAADIRETRKYDYLTRHL